MTTVGDQIQALAPDLREQLAELCHSQWSGWMRHLFCRAVVVDGYATILVEDVQRWQRQMMSSYDQLTEAEKDSDRAEADRILEILKAVLPAPPTPPPICFHCERPMQQRDGEWSCYPCLSRQEVADLQAQIAQAKTEHDREIKALWPNLRRENAHLAIELENAGAKRADLEAQIETLRAALQSIACQEAALVAKAALNPQPASASGILGQSLPPSPSR